MRGLCGKRTLCFVTTTIPSTDMAVLSKLMVAKPVEGAKRLITMANEYSLGYVRIRIYKLDLKEKVVFSKWNDRDLRKDRLKKMYVGMKFLVYQVALDTLKGVFANTVSVIAGFSLLIQGFGHLH